MMKAFQLTQHGGPEALVMRMDVAVPEPGAGEVRIRVSAAGLNNTDIWSREGAYGTPDNPDARAGWKRVPLAFPRIQGGDVAGYIDAVGAGIARSRVGQRVVLNPVIYGRDRRSGGIRDCSLIGSELDGGFAEYVVVPADNAVAIETALSDEELAALPIAYLTAERMLGRTGLQRGESVLVTGASGGVGSALVQLARARGASVTAIAGAQKYQRVRELGADEVIARDAWERDGTTALPDGGESIDVVADVVAGGSLAALLDALAYAGRYVIAGAIAGALATIDLRTIYLKQLTLIGSSVGTWDDFRRLVRLAESQQLRPPIAATYPLEELPAAQAHFQRKDFVGNIIVHP